MSGWVGWVGFASFMLLLAGIFSALAGFVALFKDSVVYHSATNSVWVLDYTQWGWIHIIVGLLAILASASLMAGNMYGRIIAVLVALVSAFANMAFVPVYPVWSVMIILVDVLIIFAVTVHGKEVKNLE
jgi:hypothetical protein